MTQKITIKSTVNMMVVYKKKNNHFLKQETPRTQWQERGNDRGGEMLYVFF